MSPSVRPVLGTMLLFKLLAFSSFHSHSYDRFNQSCTIKGLLSSGVKGFEGGRGGRFPKFVMRTKTHFLGNVILIFLLQLHPKEVTCFQQSVKLTGSRSKNFRRISILHSNLSEKPQEANCNPDTAALSFVRLNHPETDVDITIIGCLHGSSSSANDVSQLLRQATTDCVVLELCPTRYKDLTREIDRRTTSDSNSNGSYVKMVRKTMEARGFATGLAAGVLGGASGISTTLSGFEPGLEFITAIDYSMSNSDVDVVLADRMVDETLKRVGCLPSVSFEMIQEYIDSGFHWSQTYGRDASVLANAVAGQGDSQLDMRRALVRNKDVVLDLVRLTLPTLLLVESANLFLGSFFNGSNDIGIDVTFTMVDLASIMTASDWFDLAIEFLSSVISLFLGYILVALPTSKIILSERDDQLAKGIDDACHFVSKRYSDRNDGKRGRVVCVLGFLHVNGVANKLLGR